MSGVSAWCPTSQLTPVACLIAGRERSSRAPRHNPDIVRHPSIRLIAIPHSKSSIRLLHSSLQFQGWLSTRSPGSGVVEHEISRWRKSKARIRKHKWGTKAVHALLIQRQSAWYIPEYLSTHIYIYIYLDSVLRDSYYESRSEMCLVVLFYLESIGQLWCRTIISQLFVEMCIQLSFVDSLCSTQDC